MGQHTNRICPNLNFGAKSLFSTTSNKAHIRAISIFIAKTLYTYEIMWNGSGIIKEVEM